MKLTKNFDAFDFEIIPMAGITVSYRDRIAERRDICRGNRPSFIIEQKVIIARNNDHDSNEYASISILQTYP